MVEANKLCNKGITRGLDALPAPPLPIDGSRTRYSPPDRKYKHQDLLPDPLKPRKNSPSNDADTGASFSDMLKTDPGEELSPQKVNVAISVESRSKGAAKPPDGCRQCSTGPTVGNMVQEIESKKPSLRNSNTTDASDVGNLQISSPDCAKTGDGDDEISLRNFADINHDDVCALPTTKVTTKTPYLGKVRASFAQRSKFAAADKDGTLYMHNINEKDEGVPLRKVKTGSANEMDTDLADIPKAVHDVNPQIKADTSIKDDTTLISTLSLFAGPRGNVSSVFDGQSPGRSKTRDEAIDPMSCSPAKSGVHKTSQVGVDETSVTSSIITSERQIFRHDASSSEHRRCPRYYSPEEQTGALSTPSAKSITPKPLIIGNATETFQKPHISGQGYTTFKGEQTPEPATMRRSLSGPVSYGNLKCYVSATSPPFSAPVYTYGEPPVLRYDPGFKRFQAYQGILDIKSVKDVYGLRLASTPMPSPFMNGQIGSKVSSPSPGYTSDRPNTFILSPLMIKDPKFSKSESAHVATETVVSPTRFRKVSQASTITTPTKSNFKAINLPNNREIGSKSPRLTESCQLSHTPNIAHKVKSISKAGYNPDNGWHGRKSPGFEKYPIFEGSRGNPRKSVGSGGYKTLSPKGNPQNIGRNFFFEDFHISELNAQAEADADGGYKKSWEQTAIDGDANGNERKGKPKAISNDGSEQSLDYIIKGLSATSQDSSKAVLEIREMDEATRQQQATRKEGAARIEEIAAQQKKREDFTAFKVS